jgi:hypothetical protein
LLAHRQGHDGKEQGQESKKRKKKKGKKRKRKAKKQKKATKLPSFMWTKENEPHHAFLIFGLFF